jgi:cytochrome c oxidase cbb3-type subunit 2
MPSYAPLFRNNNPAGEALVAYLDSLGTETRLARAAFVANWQPAPPSRTADPSLGRMLFAQLCAQCHGTSAKGDGPLSKKLTPPPADLASGHWRYVAAFGPDETLALARVIKFGIVGTSMPGHEWLSDAKVIALAHWVLSQRR